MPTCPAGKTFTIFYSLVGCALIAKSLSDFVKYPLARRVMRNEEKVLSQFASSNLKTSTLKLLFENEFHQLVPDLKRAEDEMSKSEFVLLVLLMMEKVQAKDVFLVAKLFENFEGHQKGYLDQHDMLAKLQWAEQQELEQGRRDMLLASNPASATVVAADDVRDDIERGQSSGFGEAGGRQPTPGL